MWILDVQSTLDFEPAYGFKSIVLKKNTIYSLGRSQQSDIQVELKKVSRRQIQMQVREENDLILINEGHATWEYRGFHNEKDIMMMKGGDPTSFAFTKDNIFKVKGVDWVFKAFKIVDFQISRFIKNEIDCDFLDVSNDLPDGYIKVNGDAKKVLNLSDWISKLKAKKWTKIGQLNSYILPETENIVIDLDAESGQETEMDTGAEDEDEKMEHQIEEHSNVQDKIQIIDTIDKVIPVVPAIEKKPEKKTTNLVEIAPFHSQLTNRESTRNKRSQLAKLFDEMDDMEDLETYTSQSTHKYTSRSTQLRPSQPPPIPEENPSDELVDISRLSLKRKVTPDVETPSKKQKSLLDVSNNGLDDESKEDVKPKIKKLSSIIPGSLQQTGSNKLAEMFKKTKQIKMDQILEDEKLIKSPPNLVKIKKFQLNVQQENINNPKVYSNYNMSFGDNPQWENRLNYSKFIKSTNGNNYNPIMDSTIKTVKFKNSNYKSNEFQVNLEQNNDMIPELDSMFPSESSETRKRRREHMLFVDSDDDDDAYEDEPQITQTNSTSRNNNTNRASSQRPEIVSTRGTQSLLEATSRRMTQRNLDLGDDDDDDTPVFKSRRR